MQDTFLNFYSKLNQNLESGISESNLHLTGLWLAHGDEPLLHQWLVDSMRTSWRAQNLAIKRIELVSSKTWQDVLSELNSLSLFDDATAVIVTGNHKPDKNTQAELETFGTEANSGNNENCLLWLTAKVDKRSQSSKWFSPFAKFGQVIDCNLYNEQQRQHILAIHADRFGLDLSSEAWQFLMIQTEHHLLSAYQALWRLSYLFAPNIESVNNSTNDHNSNINDSNTNHSNTNHSNINHFNNNHSNDNHSNVNHPNINHASNQNNSSRSNNDFNANSKILIDVEKLQSALVSDSQYTVFDLSDAMLAGNAPQVIKIIEQLRATDEPSPLVLWAINKDMRLIMQLMDGQDPRSIGIWSSKQSLYQSACRRQTPESIADWADILYQCDKAVKGVVRQPAWELMLQASLRVTGVLLFA